MPVFDSLLVGSVLIPFIGAVLSISRSSRTAREKPAIKHILITVFVYIVVVYIICTLAYHMNWESDLLGISTAEASEQNTPVKITIPTEEEAMQRIDFTEDVESVPSTADMVSVHDAELHTDGYYREFPTSNPDETIVLSFSGHVITGQFDVDSMEDSHPWSGCYIYSVTDDGEWRDVEFDGFHSRYFYYDDGFFAVELPDGLPSGTYVCEVVFYIENTKFDYEIYFYKDDGTILCMMEE